jgi:hypothetical protein
MFLRVIKAIPESNCHLKVWFDTGEVKSVDLSAELDGEIFFPLKDPAFFKQCFVSHNTVEWKNGADFAPEFLYEIGKTLPKELINKTLR